MEKYTVVLEAQKNVTVDVSNFLEACLATAGYQQQYNVAFQDWQFPCGYVHCFETKRIVGYIDYFCNLWLGLPTHKLDIEEPYFLLRTGKFNFRIH